MSGLQKVSYVVKCIVTACNIHDLLEFNKKWQDKYKNHNTDVCALIKEGYTYHSDFLQFLILVKNCCNRSCAALNNIKMELEIAIEIQEFDNIFLQEIQEAFQNLQTTFESLYEKTVAIKKDIAEFDNELGKKKKSIRSDVRTYNNLVFINTIAIVFRTCASISGLLQFETVNERSVTVAAGMAVAGLLMNDQDTKLRKFERLNGVVDYIIEQKSELYGSVDMFNEIVCGIGENINTFIDSTRKTVQQGTNRENMLVVNENGRLETKNGPNARNRVVTKARGMIETTNHLLAQLKGLEVDTIAHSKELRAKIRQESPRSLIEL